MNIYKLSEDKSVIVTDDNIMFVETSYANGFRYVLTRDETFELVKSMCEYAGHALGCPGLDVCNLEALKKMVSE